jgi:riboflavin kinase/FMN adenylyltransferase
MELIRGLYNLRGDHHDCVATIGNFDGFHLGHQAVIEQCSQKSIELGLPVTLITFEPQPREYFHPQSAPARLTRLREKIQVLRGYGVGRLLCLPFNAHLAGLDPETFIREILVDGVGVKYLVVGDDFRFGKDRAGTFSLLQQAGVRHGFEVASMHTFCMGDDRVSSTRVREALECGDLVTAQSLLGRPYAMSGRVAHGDKRGRTIGFPTANVFLHRTASPVAGVFAVVMDGVDTAPVAGVANVGSRPTVGGTRALLEVHLFDFDRDIYGRHVQVSFLKKIRDERRFESFEALQQQIRLDAGEAKDFFRSTPG